MISTLRAKPKKVREMGCFIIRKKKLMGVKWKLVSSEERMWRESFIYQWVVIIKNRESKDDNVMW